MSPRPLLDARSLTRTFGDRVAVGDLSLDLRAGEIVALLGPNGAGKTTTLRLLSGLLMPTSGTIEIDGTPLTRQTAGALHRRIGLLTEVPGLWERLSVEANLLTYARLHGVRSPGARVTTLLAIFGLDDRRADPAGTLSRGMKQKVALARTLLHEPAVVLLDEPTSGLDPAMTRTVRELIVAMRHEGRAVLVSTHNLDEAERLADRVGVLQTTLLALEPPQALRRRLFGTRVRVVLTGDAQPFLGLTVGLGLHDAWVEHHALVCPATDPGVTTPPLVRALVEAGAGILSVSEEHAALEDVYLALVGKGPGEAGRTEAQ